MASSIQLLRSATTRERPLASNLLDGQPAVNTNATEPGLFFKTSDGSLVKVGPTTITTDGLPPNFSGVGSPGNSLGEMWLDKSLDPPVLKVYDGTSWVSAGSGGSPTNGTMLRWTKTATSGQTSLSGTDDDGILLSYSPGLEQVYINGVFLERGVDYLGTDGNSLTNLAPLANGDIVSVIAFSPGFVNNIYTALESTTVETNVPANAGVGGRCLIALCSRNTSVGTAVDSGVYMINVAYDGDNAPVATLISGSNLFSFGVSVSGNITATSAAASGNYRITFQG